MSHEGLAADVAAMRGRLEAVEREATDALQLVHTLGDALGAMRDRLEEAVADLVGKVEALELKVHSTNRSAPSKRNMNDGDALRVLTGDLRELPHKEAAEAAGLTYAQVYSARCEFTFKHVHKELRDSGWKNPFRA